MIVAGIVTFEPDLERLKENLSAIAPQVDGVVVFDNASIAHDAIRSIVSQFPHAHMISGDENLGIAAALNRIADWARASGAEWVVTLDQDSVATEGMVAELLATASQTGASMAAPYIVDRNKMSVEDYRSLQLPRSTEFRQAARRGAITSGALTSVQAILDVGGFDEEFFIDYVDYDFNQRIQLSGGKIMRSNWTYLLHEVGRARETWLRVPRKDIDGSIKWERFYSFGHSPQRCYYKARNRILFTRKYWRDIGWSHEGVLQIPQQIALTVLFESDKRQKLKYFARGVRDGMRHPL